jgi:hypothetical protein
LDLLNSSSSNSSASSISNDKLNEITHLEKLNLNTNTNTNTEQTTTSAFQPYKRPPDPFVSAPFDHVPSSTTTTTATNKGCISPSSSITPTSLSVHSSGGGYKFKKKQLDPNSPRKRSTTVNYRSNSKTRESNDNNKTPATKKTVPNPFMNAPFTAKKSSKQISISNSYQTIKSSNLVPVSSQPVPPPPIASSNSLNSIDESQVTPTLSNYSSMDSNATPVSASTTTTTATAAASAQITNVQFIQSLTSSSFQTQNLTTKSHFKNSTNNNNNEIKIPQSHSLNEIKPSESVVNTVLLTSKYNSNNNDDQFEPIIDTSKLQFKKRTQQQQPQQINKQIADKKLPLTKSCSANSSILQTNSDNNKPNISNKKITSSNTAAASSSGGIANMSFDDY